MFAQRRRRRNGPACPACGRRMTFIRDIADAGRAARTLNVFECKNCVLAYTIEAEAESKEQSADINK
jgi:hypothetical protein